VKLDVVTLKESGLPKGDIDAGRKWVKEKEGKEILARLKAGEVVLALDEKGKEYTSTSFARLLDSFRDSGTPDLTFIRRMPLADEILQKLTEDRPLPADFHPRNGGTILDALPLQPERKTYHY
jgi:hypothetical protein